VFQKRAEYLWIFSSDNEAIKPCSSKDITKNVPVNYDTSIQMNTYFMALVFASIPPFIIFAFFQKRILGGINVGGVKG